MLSQLKKLGQPRHRYTAETRRAAVALLKGDLDDASDRIERAADFGRRIYEPEASLVRMAQRLELVRARGEPGQLIVFAEEALGAWAGAPILANALAAGFLAHAGELVGAGRHLAIVVDLGTWVRTRPTPGPAWCVSSAWPPSRSVTTKYVHNCWPMYSRSRTVAASTEPSSPSRSHAHTAGLLLAGSARKAAHFSLRLAKPTGDSGRPLVSELDLQQAGDGGIEGTVHFNVYSRSDQTSLKACR